MYLERIEEKVIESEESEGVVDLKSADEGTHEVGRLLQCRRVVTCGLGLGLPRGRRGCPNLHLSRLDVVPKRYSVTSK